MDTTPSTHDALRGEVRDVFTEFGFGSSPTTDETTAQLFSIVTDPFLRKVLKAGEDTKAQALAVLDLIDKEPDAEADKKAHALEVSKAKKLLYARIAILRNLNRQAILKMRDNKQKTAEARMEVDTLHLQMQNLYYEQQHLKSEIAACMEFNHEYQKLNMIPVEEFLELFPEHKGADEDTLMRARIAHELTERKALEEKRQALAKKKQALTAQNKKRKEDLANLDKDLEKFIEAAKPIEETFKKDY